MTGALARVGSPCRQGRHLPTVEKRRPVHVLLFGSYWPMVRALEQALTEGGYRVDVVTDIQEAVSRASVEDYDIVILDLKRPADVGPFLDQNWEPGYLKSHVLILTPPRSVEECRRSQGLGPDNWLAKPFAFEDLFLRLRNLVRA